MKESKSKKSLKITDLDIVMPEKMIYDFGDMVLLSLADESEKDLSKVTVRDDIFESMTKGIYRVPKTF